MISKDQFLKRIKFHKDYERFKNRRKKPISIEDIEVPIPKVDNSLFKKNLPKRLSTD